MSTVPREEYDRYWQSHRSGPPSTDPRGAHHGEPDPEYVTLCGEADRLGMRVLLDVGAETFGPRKRQYRQLAALRISDPDGKQASVMTRFESGDTIRSVAERARRSLEAA